MCPSSEEKTSGSDEGLFAPLFVDPSNFREFLKNVVKFSILQLFSTSKAPNFRRIIFCFFCICCRGQMTLSSEEKISGSDEGFLR